MKKILVGLGIAVLVVIGIAIVKPWYVLVEGEQAVVLKFGEIVRVVQDAGLKLKVPFIENVDRYSKKIQSWDGAATRLPTAENQFIWVDTSARWRITDPKKFYESVGSMNQALGRLDDIIDSSVRKVIALHPMREAVRNSNVISEIKRDNLLAAFGGGAETAAGLSSIATLMDITYERIELGRRKLSDAIVAAAAPTIAGFGMELIDVIIRQIKYSDDLTPAVYERMIKERSQIAQAFRSDGEGEKAKWLGQMERELAQITSDAERRAKEIKAKADAEALAIRNKAYTRDSDFADYWMALEAYKVLLPRFNKTLTTDAEFFKYLYSRRGR